MWGRDLAVGMLRTMYPSFSEFVVIVIHGLHCSYNQVSNISKNKHHHKHRHIILIMPGERPGVVRELIIVNFDPITPVFVSVVYIFMMTSSNGNIFRVAGPLCREFTGHQWISLTKVSGAELWCFLHLNKWLIKNQDAGDLRCHHAHYDVTVMSEDWWTFSNLWSPSWCTFGTHYIIWAFIDLGIPYFWSIWLQLALELHILSSTIIISTAST